MPKTTTKWVWGHPVEFPVVVDGQTDGYIAPLSPSEGIFRYHTGVHLIDCIIV